MIVRLRRAHHRSACCRWKKSRGQNWRREWEEAGEGANVETPPCGSDDGGDISKRELIIAKRLSLYAARGFFGVRPAGFRAGLFFNCLPRNAAPLLRASAGVIGRWTPIRSAIADSTAHAAPWPFRSGRLNKSRSNHSTHSTTFDPRTNALRGLCTITPRF